MSRGERFKFIESYVGRRGQLRYRWQRHVPGDSRVEEITCDADWFWGHPS